MSDDVKKTPLATKQKPDPYFQDELEQVRRIVWKYLNPKTDKAFVFGSRATRQVRRTSDLDVGIRTRGKVPWEKMAKLNEAFEKSRLPFTVDVVDFGRMPIEFTRIAEKKVLPLN